MSFISLTILAPLLCSSTPAQIVGGESGPTYQWDGPTVGSHFGTAVAGAGDLNNDGFADVIIGAYGYNGGGLQSGYAAAYSGATGDRLRRWEGSAQGDHLGWAVAGVGDLDQDGFDDVALAAPGADFGGVVNCGSVLVMSGRNGTVLHRWNGHYTHGSFGISIAAVGDVNQDGIADVLIGAGGESANDLPYSGSAYLYSGADGSILQQWHGQASNDRFGSAVAKAGDVNADGKPDFVIGALGASPGGVIAAGAAYALSGLDGSILHKWIGDAAMDRLGASVAPAGDVDGDGYTDLCIGILQADSPTTADTGGAMVCSGRTGNVIHKWFGAESGDLHGYSLANAGDVDEDGVADMLVSTFHAEDHGVTDGGAVSLYSGADGSQLLRWNGQIAYGRFGSSVANCGDLDGDGIDNFLIGADGYDAGSTFAYQFLPFMQTSVHTISADHGGRMEFSLDFPAAARFYTYKILISASGKGPFHDGVDIPLTWDSLVQDTDAGNYPMPDTQNMHGNLDYWGQANAGLRLPGGLPAAIIGRSFYFAAVASPLGADPAYSSIATTLTFLP